jgi:ribosomal protein L19
MKKKLNSGFTGLIMVLLIIVPSVSNGQSEKAVIKKYLSELPDHQTGKTIQKYKMTAVYTNRDLYGNFTGKIKVSGDYTKGLPGDSAAWNNVYIAHSSNEDQPFEGEMKQDYMENFRYVPSAKMVEEKEAFKDFPSSLETVYAKNLVWDMLSFEIFAWNYYDSLKLNKTYIVPDINGQFDIAGVGKYSHKRILISWKGISEINGELCAIIDFDAIDNKIEFSMNQIKTKGTEQYWGTVMVSMKTKNIESAEMFSGTIQEIEVTGMKDKILVKTIRELEVNRIQ